MKHLNQAKPYSDAAFAFAKDNKQIELWRAFLSTMAHIFTDKELPKLLKNRKLTTHTLIEVLTTNFEKSTPAMGNFLRLLAENKRLTILPEIYELFEKDAEHDQRIVEVKLTFADKPTTAELESLQPALKKKFGPHIKETITIDAHILSGVIIQSGDYVIDGSLKGQLENLKQELMRV